MLLRAQIAFDIQAQLAAWYAKASAVSMSTDRLRDPGAACCPVCKMQLRLNRILYERRSPSRSRSNLLPGMQKAITITSRSRSNLLPGKQKAIMIKTYSSLTSDGVEKKVPTWRTLSTCWTKGNYSLPSIRCLHTVVILPGSTVHCLDYQN